MTNAEEIRMAHRHCIKRNYAGGFTCFKIDRETEFHEQWGLVALFHEAAEGKNVNIEDLKKMGYTGGPDDIITFLKAANKIAMDPALSGSTDYVGAMPQFEIGPGPTYYRGVTFIREEAAEYRRLHRDELSFAGYMDSYGVGVPHVFRAVHDFARNNGFVSGFPTYTEDEETKNEYIRVVLLKEGYAQYLEKVPDTYYWMTNHVIDDSFTDEFKIRLYTALDRASASIQHSVYLHPEEKKKLIHAFRETIHWAPYTGTRNIYARTIRNQKRIEINVPEFDINSSSPTNPEEPLNPDTNLAITAIHELMHIADDQYNHPDISNGINMGCDINSTDPYYGTPPLRAECCIVGKQSLRLTQTGKPIETDEVTDN